MKKASKVSVVIPSYNSARFLHSSVNSVQSQTYANFEIIIVDDGSTDDTREIAKEFGNGVSYFFQENKGPSAARNLGLNVARGEYIQFLDADDTISPDKFERQSRFLDDHPHVDAVYSDYEVVDSEGSVIKEATQRLTMGGFGTRTLLDMLLYEGVLAIHCAMFRKASLEQYGGFDESVRCFEDWDLWLRMLLCGAKFHYLPGVMAQYTKYGNSSTDNSQLLYDSRRWLLEKFSRDERLQKMPEKFKDFRAYQQKSLGDNHYNRREWAEARRYYSGSLRERWDAGVGMLIAKTIAHQVLSGK